MWGTADLYWVEHAGHEGFVPHTVRRHMTGKLCGRVASLPQTECWPSLVRSSKFRCVQRPFYSPLSHLMICSEIHQIDFFIWLVGPPTPRCSNLLPKWPIKMFTILLMAEWQRPQHLYKEKNDPSQCDVLASLYLRNLFENIKILEDQAHVQKQHFFSSGATLKVKCDV